MIEYLNVCLVMLFILIVGGIPYYLLWLDDYRDIITPNKERQLQAQLDAHADEMQRLRFRLRRIEDKLGIKEGED